MRRTLLALIALAAVTQPALAQDKALSVQPGMKPDVSETRCGMTTIKVTLVALKADPEIKAASLTRVRALTINGDPVSDLTLSWINGSSDGFGGGFQGLAITCGDNRIPATIVATNSAGQVTFEVDSGGFLRRKS